MQKANISSIDNIVCNQDIIDFCAANLNITKEKADEMLYKYNILQDERGYRQYYIGELQWDIAYPYEAGSSYHYKDEEGYKEYNKYRNVVVDFMKFNEIGFIYLEY